MKAIIRQMKANLRSHRLQAVLLSVTLLAAATLLTVALHTFDTAQNAFDRLFDRTHAPHLWLVLDPQAMPVEELERTLAHLPGVEQTGRGYRTVPTTLFLGDVREIGPALRHWPDEDDAVGHPLLVEGRIPEPGETDVLVLDYNRAVEYDVQIGDAIGVLTPTGRQDLTIIGLFVSTEICPTCYPFITYVGTGTISDLDLLSNWDDDIGAVHIGLRLTHPSETQSVLQSAIDTLPEDTVWSWNQWQDLRSYSDSSVQLQRILLLTFSGVALLAAGVLIVNTIRGTLRSQTRQMGLLRAIGFTAAQLAWVYQLEYLGLALIASLIGLLAGSFLSAQTLRSITLMFGDALIRPAPWILMATPLVTLSITALSAAVALRKAARLNIVEVIRRGEERPRFRRGSLGKGALRRMPLPLMLGLHEILSQPGRSWLLAITLVTAVVTIVSGFTLQTTLQRIVSDPAELGFDGDLSISRTRYISEDEVLQLIASRPEVVSCYSERWRSFHFPGENIYYQAKFREGDLSDFRFPVVEGRMFEKPGEAIAGYGLVRERDLQMGDSIEILINDSPVTTQIVGFYRENSNNGRMLILPAETLRSVWPEVEMGTFVLKLQPGTDHETIAAELTEQSNEFLDIRSFGMDDLPASVSSLPTIMSLLTIVLAVIAALGVSNITWLAVQERKRDYSILKSVGMTPGQITAAVLTGSGAIAVGAYVLGLPLGLLGIRSLMSSVSTSIGFGPLALWTNEGALILLLPSIVLLAALGALIPALRAARTNVIDVVRYE
ncbi:MAG TPA: ABC transporter permease [Anaerolineae bacterium]|nr:ABC transporter permease [Anaerolineae bacterium]